MGSSEHRTLGVELARLVIIAVLVAALLGLLSTHIAGPAAAPILEPLPAELSSVSAPVRGAETRTSHLHSTDPAVAAGSIDAALRIDPGEGWFDASELKLSAVGDDKSEMFVDPRACVYPDSFLRNLAGGRDDCGFLKPGTDESEILTLPFLALAGWVLVICSVAAVYHFHRNWRVQLWLRRVQAQGLARSATNLRRPPHRRVRRASRQGEASSRRYAG